MDLEKLTGTLKTNEAGQVVITTDKPERTKLEQEIESIRRTLYNAIDRLERLKPSKLTTT
jgi:hypothetical protein